jgi:hypothetical protein
MNNNLHIPHMQVIRVRTTISTDAGFLTANSSFMHIQNVQQRIRSCSAPLTAVLKWENITSYPACQLLVSKSERNKTYKANYVLDIFPSPAPEIGLGFL